MVFNYAADEAAAQALSAELDSSGYAGQYQILKVDLSQLSGIDQLLQGLAPQIQFLDYLVLNAGATWRGGLQDLTAKEWEYVMNTNLTVPLFLTQRCTERLTPGGCVLFVGSLLGRFPHALSIPYGTSKAAVHYLAQSLVKEFAPAQVRVNCLCPGFVETPWQAQKPAEVRASIEGKIALHRFAEPEEIAQMACAILENPYMNGAVVNIDGGYCFQ